MSELINNSSNRKDLLKHLIFQLHKGSAPQDVKKQLVQMLGKVPYADVVDVEQELISEGLPQKEVLKFCDIHTEALKGALDHSKAKTAPAGHPIHTFQQENRALEREIKSLRKVMNGLDKDTETVKTGIILLEIRGHFNALIDVNKHYSRKENLLFPFLEKYNITGPSTVMWGKHDETRELLRAVLEVLDQSPDITGGEAQSIVAQVFEPALNSIEEMIYKEEQILFPMALDTLSEKDWFDISRQSIEIGFCLYDPEIIWQPDGIQSEELVKETQDRIQLSSGNFSIPELTALLNTIPFDITFVDKDDTVRYFSEGKERIFARNRAILGRKVHHCHPPKSVHIVEKIVSDFRSGREDHAAFYITMNGRFIHIEYFALRDIDGKYLGVLEVSQDLTEKRKLEGEKRLLSYSEESIEEIKAECHES